ncbi:MAG TPA: universal stress protein [Candidatus Angelobacter sp.]|nr:universal stress protein [Candidatus Angelobacter sp.]
MKILVAVDDSKHSEAAINVVASCFKPQTTEIKILHVLIPITLSAIPQMARGYAPELDQQRTQARALVDKYAQKLRADGYKVDSAVDDGDARETIIESADRWHADLVVLGSRGHKGMERLLLGSVAESVVRHANCSVLVVRMPAS